jgi:hypothetical protein
MPSAIGDGGKKFQAPPATAIKKIFFKTYKKPIFKQGKT